MREMVLNHASVLVPDRNTAVEWLKDIAISASTLVHKGIAQKSLRMCHYDYEIPCLEDWSLYDAYEELRRSGARDEYALLRGLSAKVPLLSEVEWEVADRFRMCEAVGCDAIALSSKHGEPLVLCAITDGIAVGFPSRSVWDRDRITVTFDEMLPDGRIEEVSEIIDNLARHAHAESICARFRDELRQLTSPAALWQAREAAFPSLQFGLDVESHLAGLNRGHLGTVVGKLASLDEAASQWWVEGGPAPQWTCQVTDESKSVHQSARLREARRFRSYRGTRELFTWHARYGSGGRIHLRFDAATREVEIGYVGPHLL